MAFTKSSQPQVMDEHNRNPAVRAHAGHGSGSEISFAIFISR